MTEVLWEMKAGIPMHRIVGNEQATRTSGTEPKYIMFDPLIPEEYFEAEPNPLDYTDTPWELLTPNIMQDSADRKLLIELVHAIRILMPCRG